MIRELLQEKIREKGAIGFDEFMETALYHPALGYYSQRNTSDDFYTSADVHPVFGGVLAKFFYQEWVAHFKPEEKIQIVELGCGTGKLAKAILDAASKKTNFYEAIRYVAIERSDPRAAQARESNAAHAAYFSCLPDFSKLDSPIKGIIFSNEFFDALPVKRVVRENNELKEITVGPDLKEILRKPSAELEDYFRWLGVSPEEGCKGEAHLAAREWMRKIADHLDQGTVLTIDYGYEAGELYFPIRTEGTLLCHEGHQTHRNYFSDPGKADLTAHVNFTALIREGADRGLVADRLRTQSQFLLDQGLDEMMREIQASKDARAHLKASSAVKSLIHPEGMGGTFKVLVQRKY